MKIIFHENQLSYRGTSNAVFNYAHYNEEILNNESLILYNKNNKQNFNPAIDRFKKKFKVIAYEDVSEIEKIVEKEKASLFYAIKAGKKDGIQVSIAELLFTLFLNIMSRTAMSMRMFQNGYRKK